MTDKPIVGNQGALRRKYGRAGISHPVRGTGRSFDAIRSTSW
jgi:hypothetical protein